MSATVLAFQAPKPQQPRPWQNHELAELYRAVDILNKAGLAVDTDMGVSDEGDPWFVFCRADTGDVIVHCARINGAFVASSIAVVHTFRGGNFREVIDSIVKYQPLGIPVATSGSRLFLHPMMVLAAFVATALLCSKKAEAHDLHSAVVSLAQPDAPAAHKGLAAFKAAVSEFLSGLAPSHFQSNTKLSAAAAVVESEPVPLAALMAAAIGILGPAFESTAATLSADATSATVTEQSLATALVADPTALLAAAHDNLLPQSTAPSAVPMSSAVDWSRIAELKLAVDAVLLADHTAQVRPEAVAASFHSGPGQPDTPFAPLADHLILRPVAQDRIAAAPPSTPVVASDSSPAPSASQSTEATHQIDIGNVTPIAVSIFASRTVAQPQADALTLLLQSKSHADSSSATAASSSSAAVTVTPVEKSGFHTSGATDATVSVVPPVSDDIVVIPFQPETPPPIVIGIDPTLGLAQLSAYALGQHPVQGTMNPSPILTAAIAVYTSEIGSLARIVVFDSSAMQLPFFEFQKGVLFVDDHDLGITPSDAALTGSTTVILASGGSMQLLGVTDTAHLTHLTAA